MAVELRPGDYLDTVYGPGVHVVVLHCDGDGGLGRRAVAQMDHVERRFHGSKNVRLWACKVKTPDDAELVQAVKMPQIRFFRDGSETYSHVGVMAFEEILDKVFSMGDR